MRLPLVAALFASVAALPAAAQTAPDGAYDAILTLGGGARFQPEWDGAKSYTLSPFPIVGLKFLRSPFSGEAVQDGALSISPTFRALTKRNFKAGDPLFGLTDVGLAVELGVKVEYTGPWYRAFVEVRQGVGGHQGELLDLGVDGILRPDPKWTLAAGPRLSFASADYMQTYFGVSRADSLRSGIAAYDAHGGFRGAGLGGSITWDVDRAWFIRADASWTRLSNTAADSPVVRLDGSRDQFTVGLGAAYKLGVNWH